MDECTREDFGKRPIKAKEQLCYDVIGSGPRSIEQQGNNSNTSCRDALLQFNGKSFNPKVIDDIFSVYEEFTREHSNTTYRTNTQLAAKVLNCVYMSKAQLFTENHSTTPREEKSAERSRQGDRSIAPSGNTPPQEQNHTNNIEMVILDRSTFPQKELHSSSNENIASDRVICSQLQKTPQSKSTAVQKVYQKRTKHPARTLLVVNNHTTLWHPGLELRDYIQGPLCHRYHLAHQKKFR